MACGPWSRSRSLLGSNLLKMSAFCTGWFITRLISFAPKAAMLAGRELYRAPEVREAVKVGQLPSLPPRLSGVCPVFFGGGSRPPGPPRGAPGSPDPPGSFPGGLPLARTPPVLWGERV